MYLLVVQRGEFIGLVAAPDINLEKGGRYKYFLSTTHVSN